MYIIMHGNVKLEDEILQLLRLSGFCNFSVKTMNSGISNQKIKEK